MFDISAMIGAIWELIGLIGSGIVLLVVLGIFIIALFGIIDFFRSRP